VHLQGITYTVIALSALLPEYNTHIKWSNQLSINSSPWL